MGLFNKRCEYCREKIGKGMEYFEEVKIPGYIGVFKRPFCSEGHADMYVKEINNTPIKKGGGCCG